MLKGRSDGGLVKYEVRRRASVKDVIEALGVPHTEVGRISVNGRDVDFKYLLTPDKEEGGRENGGQEKQALEIGIHGFTCPVDVTMDTVLRTGLPRVKFMADENVERLGIYLRLMGFDVAKGKGLSDKEIADICHDEQRAALSRDRALLRRSKVQWGRLIREDLPEDQLVEVVDFFGLEPQGKCFNRCVRCNLALVPVDKKEVEHLLLPKTKKYFQTFYRCPECGRIYWQGSHHDRMKEFLRSLGLGGCG